MITSTLPGQCLIFLLVLLAWSLVVTTAASVQQSDLETMSDAELEAICTNLGFVVIDQDPETGHPIQLTHTDYVEAARQCLTIEAEMEEILNENPELREEFMQELDRMMQQEQAENERLLKEKERLEKELKEAKGHDTREEDSAGETEKTETIGQVETKTDAVTDNEHAVAESLSSPREKLQDAIDGVLPKPLQAVLIQVFIKLKQQAVVLLRFAQRQLQALLGQLKQKLEETKQEKNETSS